MEPLRMGDPVQVGPYQLVGRLGASDLGQGFTGRHPAGTMVTVTVLHPHLAGDPQFRGLFRRAVDDARRGGGPFVLPVEADTESPMPWLVTGSHDVPSLAVVGGGSGAAAGGQQAAWGAGQQAAWGAGQPWWRAVPASVVAGFVVLAAVAVLALTAGDGSDDSLVADPGVSAPGQHVMPSLPGLAPSDGSSDPDDSDDGGNSDDPSDDSQDPAATPTQDPIADAATGDCFDNAGTAKTAELTPATCEPQTFKVVRVLHGTTSTSGCDKVPDDSWNVSYPGRNLVLCLSYQYENGSAYHAVAGDCVYGESATSDWDKLACQTGAFTVQKRLTGTTDGSSCKNLRNNDWAEHFGVTGRSDLGVTLCLTMIYPDDAGHATLNQCMRMSGTATRPKLAAVSCGSANVLVTGRTPKYNDSKFCGNDAWTTWKPNNYPDLAYTVCYRHR